MDAAPARANEPSASCAPPTNGRLARALGVGDRIGRYRIHRVVAAGGMGTVYEAEHVLLEKRVALKVLNPELAVHEELRRRFVREGLAASRVRHPHVVDVTDAAEENGHAYLVMELLEGHDLQAELAYRGRLEIAEASEIILPICAALSEAHAVGVVHRDMKPENVLLVRSFGDRALPKVVDFGISDLIGASFRHELGAVIGTPHYMAPEQALGEVVDGKADQYAVAVMLFEMLTGQLPYDPAKLEDPDALLEDVAAGRAHRLSYVWPSVPERLDALLARAMHPDPRRRFATMQRFGRALVPLASPRALRRYRDLVDPGGSTLAPAVGWPPEGRETPWSVLVTVETLADAFADDATAETTERVPRPELPEMLESGEHRTTRVDTLTSPPPEMSAAASVHLDSDPSAPSPLGAAPATIAELIPDASVTHRRRKHCAEARLAPTQAMQHLGPPVQRLRARTRAIAIAAGSAVAIASAAGAAIAAILLS